ncbi:MAG: PAS domain S-box protein [Promethearchaeia archaeon]
MAYNNLLKYSSDIVFIFDLQGNFISVNNNFLKKLKYRNKKKISELKISDIIHFSEKEYNAPELVEIFKKSYKNKTSEDFQLIGRKNEEIPVRGDSIPFKKEGKVIGILISARHTAQKKKLEHELKLKETEIKQIYQKNPEIRFWDLFQTKDSQELFRQSERLYKNLFDNAPIGICTIDKEGKILQINKRAMEVFRSDDFRILTKDLSIFNSDFFNNSDFTKTLKNAIKTEETTSKTIKFSPDKEFEKYLHIRIVPQFDQNKNFINLLCIIEDRTKLIEAQQRLKESKERYEDIFDQMEHIIYISDPSTYELLYVNDITKQAFPGKIIGRKCYKVFQDRDEPCPFCTNDKLFGKNPESPHIWDFYNEKLGKWFHIIDQSIDWGGKKVRLEFAEDITKKKETEQQLRGAEKKYQGILENIKEGYFEVNLKGEFTLCNKAFCNILKDSAESILEKSYKSFIAEDYKKYVYETFYDVYQTGIIKRAFQFRIVRGDGQKRYVESSIYLRRGRDQKIKGFSGLLKDITKRKEGEALRKEFRQELEEEVKIRTNQLNEALKKQQAYLEEILKASEFKSKFLATISHELRTPLNAIIGFADLLLEGSYGGNLSETQEGFIDDIKYSGNQLLNLINQILEISKIEEGGIKLNKKEFSLNKIVTQVVSSFRSLMDKKELKIEIENLQDNMKIIADPLRIKEILNNLISNAIKFTEEGVITLKLVERKTEWEFQISDTGIGIAQEDHEMVFSEFNQAGDPDISPKKGTGLGLSITKRLVELHQGNIWVESKLGEGTTIYFTIPKSSASRKPRS